MPILMFVMWVEVIAGTLKEELWNTFALASGGENYDHENFISCQVMINSDGAHAIINAQ